MTLVTVVLDDAELGQHPRTAGHHPTGPDQLVQVELSTKVQSKTSNLVCSVTNSMVKILKETFFFQVNVKLQVK